MRRIFACILPILLLLPFLPSGSAGAQGTGSSLVQTARTPSEKADFAGAAIVEMRAASKDVARMLEAAEKDKDNARIQCLGKKLATIRALEEVSETSSTTMKQAFATGDTVAADHEYRKIAIALVKVRQFRAEAETCGGTSGQTGATTVALVDAGVAYGDEDESLETGDWAIPDPPPVSQFQ